MHLQTIPMLAVPDVPKALSYYQDTFGFEIKGQMGDPPNYAIVERDGKPIHFLFSHHSSASAQPTGGNVDEGKGGVYVEVDDVDAVARKISERAPELQPKPQDKEYGMRDFWVRDLNGYLIAFGAKLSGE